MHGDEYSVRTATYPESILPSPARVIVYALSSKRDSPAANITTFIFVSPIWHLAEARSGKASAAR